jgi:hypothetical protein
MHSLCLLPCTACDEEYLCIACHPDCSCLDLFSLSLLLYSSDVHCEISVSLLPLSLPEYERARSRILTPCPPRAPQLGMLRRQSISVHPQLIPTRFPPAIASSLTNPCQSCIHSLCQVNTQLYRPSILCRRRRKDILISNFLHYSET